jgi:colicin import membrane protein
MAETEAAKKSDEEIAAEAETARIAGLVEAAAKAPGLRAARDRAKKAAEKAAKDAEAAAEKFKESQKPLRAALHKAAQDLVPAEQAEAALRLAADPARVFKKKIAAAHTRSVELRAEMKDATSSLNGAQARLKELDGAEPVALEEAHTQVAQARKALAAAEKAIADQEAAGKAAAEEWERAFQALMAKHQPKRAAAAR